MDLMPEPVACQCLDGREITFDAEMQWAGEQYLVGTGFPTRVAAEAHAKKVCSTLRVQMRLIGLQFVAPFPKTKPWRFITPKKTPGS